MSLTYPPHNATTFLFNDNIGFVLILVPEMMDVGVGLGPACLAPVDAQQRGCQARVRQMNFRRFDQPLSPV